MDRRTFLRRAAATGAAAAWAAPVVQTITAGPAWATNGTPGGFCGHSTGNVGGTEACNGGCMAACNIVCGDTDPDCEGDPDCTGTVSAADNPGCNTLCAALCPIGEGNCNECCDPSVCSLSAFSCDGGVAKYEGTVGACTELVK